MASGTLMRVFEGKRLSRFDGRPLSHSLSDLRRADSLPRGTRSRGCSGRAVCAAPGHATLGRLRCASCLESLGRRRRPPARGVDVEEHGQTRGAGEVARNWRRSARPPAGRTAAGVHLGSGFTVGHARSEPRLIHVTPLCACGGAAPYLREGRQWQAGLDHDDGWVLGRGGRGSGEHRMGFLLPASRQTFD